MIVKNRVTEYKQSMVNIFEIKYRLSEFEAKKAINNYGFDGVLKACNFIALHDDPEIWVDTIYKWGPGDEDLLQM